MSVNNHIVVADLMGVEFRIAAIGANKACVVVVIHARIIGEAGALVKKKSGPGFPEPPASSLLLGSLCRALRLGLWGGPAQEHDIRPGYGFLTFENLEFAAPPLFEIA